MLVARIQFKEEYASDFVYSYRDDGQQTVVEQVFESPEELIAVLKEFEPYLADVTAVINGKMLSLSSFSAK